jgi:hypothetical protein
MQHQQLPLPLLSAPAQPLDQEVLPLPVADLPGLTPM